MQAKVGSFTKTTGAATASQAVTGIGFQPTVLILFTSGGLTSDTWHSDYFAAVGFSDAASSSGSAATSSQHNVAVSNCSQRVAAKALTLVKYGEVLRAECDLTSFDSDGFTLSWTTNDAIADIIGYVALAGVTAKVVALACPASTGLTSFTGAGFLPDAVLLAAARNTTAPPNTLAGAGLAFGAAARGGGQIGCGLVHSDGSGTTFQRTRLVNRLWTMPHASTVLDVSAAVVSFDSDGFTAVFPTVTTNQRGYALCLQGGTWSAPVAVKPTGAATANQLVDHLGTPLFLLCVSDHQLIGMDANAGPGLYWGLGASDGSTSVCMTVADNRVAGLSVAKALMRTDKFFVKSKNDTQTEDAVADTPTLAATQSTVPWSTNDAVATGLVFLAGGA